MTQIYVQKLEKAGMGGIVSNISGDMKIVRSVNAKKTFKDWSVSCIQCRLQGLRFPYQTVAKKSRAREQAPGLWHSKLNKLYVKIAT